MELPELFSKSNCLHKDESVYILEKYYKLINWEKATKGVKVLDVGCGTGETTAKIILPLLPDTISSLTGCDISESMLDFARSHWSGEKINYIKFDLGKDVPVDLVENYDMIFSFYCVNWIKSQRLAFTNIHKLLKVGGSILIASSTRSDLLSGYAHMATLPKYAKYMKDVDKFIPNSHNRSDIGLSTRSLLIKLGFTIQACEIHERVYNYKNIQVFRDALKSVTPFVLRMPEELQEEFMTDLVHYQIAERYEDGECVSFPYTLLVVVAQKNR